MVVADNADNLWLYSVTSLCLAIPVTINMQELFVHANRDQLHIQLAIQL